MVLKARNLNSLPILITLEEGHVVDIRQGQHEGGLFFTPKLIDLNVRPKNNTLSRKPLSLLCLKAKRGGIGALALSADTEPKVSTEIALGFIKSLQEDVEVIPLSYAMNEDMKINNLSILKDLGAGGIFIASNMEASILDNAAKYAKMLKSPLFICANDELGGLINEGEVSATLGLLARNPLSEIKEVAKICEILLFYNISGVFSALSERRSIEIVKEARRFNNNIYAECSVHHLALEDSACYNYNTNAKINPPLKDTATRMYLLRALREGNIHLLTSLQSATFNSSKEKIFEDASFGIDAIAYYFPLLNTFILKERILNIMELFKIASLHPAKILGISFLLEAFHIATREDFTGMVSAKNFLLIDLDKEITPKDPFLPYTKLYGEATCLGSINA